MNKKTVQLTKEYSMRGFSYIELLVVLGIFGILTTITIYNYNAYEQRTRFEQIVYNVAISMRQAQNFGTSSVDYVLTNFNPDDIDAVNPIGIHINYDSTKRSFTPELTLFRDTNKLGGYAFVYDKEYDSNIDTVKIPGVNQIDHICEEISPTSCINYLQSISIFFKRPHPEPFLEGTSSIQELQNGFSVVPAVPLAHPLRIELFDKTRNEIWAVRIEPSGLISIKHPQ